MFNPIVKLLARLAAYLIGFGLAYSLMLISRAIHQLVGEGWAWWIHLGFGLVALCLVLAVAIAPIGVVEGLIDRNSSVRADGTD